MGKTHSDPTADKAIGNVEKEQKELMECRLIRDMVRTIRYLARLNGYRIVGSIRFASIDGEESFSIGGN